MRGSRRTIVEVGLAALLAAAPFAWRLAAGADHLPAGDAWAYERIVRTFHETGEIALVDWNDLSLLGVVPITELWTSIVGFGSFQLHALSSIAGFVALLALRDLLITLRVDMRMMPLVVAGTCLGFVGVSGTFLVDLFSTAAALWTVALTFRALGDDATRTRVLVYSVGAGLASAYAFTVRQNAAVAIAAAVVVLWRDRRRIQGAWWVASASFAVVALPFYAWRAGLEHGGEVMLALHPRSAASALIAMWFTLGLLGLPFAAAAAVRRPRSTRVELLAYLPVAAILVAALAEPAGPLAHGDSLVGALTDRSGAIGWVLAVAVAISTCWAWTRIGRTVMPPGRVGVELLITLAVMISLEIVATVVTGGYFSRYSLISGFVMVGALAYARTDVRSSGSKSLPIAPVVVATLVAVGSYVALDRTIASVGALDQIAAIAECAGLAPANIDGGFSWNGLHYDGIANAAMDQVPRDDGLPTTDEQLVFVEMERHAVIVDSRPDFDGGLDAVGPFESTGLLPFNTADRWIIPAPEWSDRVAACTPGQD